MIKRLVTVGMLWGLLWTCGCPRPTAGTGTDAAGGKVPVQPRSPLNASDWDGMKHEYALADFCGLLIENGAAELLLHADFSAAQYTGEVESTAAGEVPIGIWVLPEDPAGEATPVGYQAQLVAFGDGARFIFGFSAAWYEEHMGLDHEQLDGQFMAMHAEYGGVLRNYGYADPDYDICFYQFNFDNTREGTWGSPYMTRKRFTMHGDVPQWDFYCIGVDAGATLATRRAFAEDAALTDRPGYAPIALPAELDPALEPDALLLAADGGLHALLQFLGIPADSGTPKEGFSLERLLKPRTRLARYAVANPEAEEASLELLVADNSTLERLAFTDAWLAQQGIDAAAFNARFEELRDSHAGWEKDIQPAGDAESPPLKDSGVQLGSWEISRRLIQLAEGIEVRSWALVPVLPPS